MAEDSRIGTTFSRLDEAPAEDAAAAVGALARMAVHPQIKRVREIALEELRPAPGRRTLRRRLLRQGLEAVTAQPVALVCTDPAPAAGVIPLATRAIPLDSGIVPRELLEPRCRLLDEAEKRGDFLATLTIPVACGTRPRR